MREATEKKNRAVRDAQAGLAQNRGRITVNQYLDKWLETVAKERVRPSTLRSDTSHVKTHAKPALKGIRLRVRQPAHVNRLLASMVETGASPTTANRGRTALSGPDVTNRLKVLLEAAMTPLANCTGLYLTID